MVRLDRHLDHIAIRTLGVLFDINANDEFDAIQLVKALDAARGGGLRCVVLRVDIAGAVERSADKAASHLAPGRPLLGQQADVAPHLAFGMLTVGDHKFGREVDRPGVEGFGGVAAAPALFGIVVTTGLDGHAHRYNGALGDQIETGLL